MKFLIYIHGDLIGEIYGVEVSYDAFSHAVALADMLGVSACLVDGETGEILIDSEDLDI